MSSTGERTSYGIYQGGARPMREGSAIIEHDGRTWVVESAVQAIDGETRYEVTVDTYHYTWTDTMGEALSMITNDIKKLDARPLHKRRLSAEVRGREA